MKSYLDSLFKKYKSDKHNHKYSFVYENFLKNLKNKKLKILEIGVADGSSIRAWSHFFKKSLIVGVDIKEIDLKKNKLNEKNIKIHCGSQTDESFINFIINKYKKFDIIIDDGSHFPKDVIKTFQLLFNALNKNGFYFVEDTQTSYNHYFKGNAFDLKYSNTHMNYFKNLCDSLNYQEIANPFYIKRKYDGLITNISFFHNMIVIKKGLNNTISNLVLKNSYENKRYKSRIKIKKNIFRYYFKYMVLFKLYTLLLFLINLIKKTILFRY
ncbi:class I SAM-dependent methyltransferase [Pelagibacteraceae bacterium]|nr:class I SAM-dependent methyltransferase [Pelagibacteraceae bacterium]